MTDPFLDAGYLLLPSCRQDHLQTEARKRWVFNFHQCWPSGSFQQNMDMSRAVVVIQNCSGAIAAVLWIIQHPLCISFTTTTMCFASVIVVENISCILDAWGVPVTGHRLPYLLIYSRSIILWARKGQIFSSLNISVLCPLAL